MMKRIAMNVSVEDLVKLMDRLKREYEETMKNVGIDFTDDMVWKQKHMVTLINKKPECSDTWEVEE